MRPVSGQGNRDKNPVEPAVEETEINFELFDNLRDEKADVNPLHVKPGFFRRIGNAIVEAFRALGEKMQRAWSAICNAFGSSEQAAEAMRHIRQQPDQRASADLQPNDLPALSLPEEALSAQRGSGSAPASEAVVPDAVAPEAVATPLGASRPSVVQTDAKAFSVYLQDFKRDQRDGKTAPTLCNQNFQEGASRHAQALYDDHAKRVAEFTGKPSEFALTADEQIEIAAASMLLRKPLPHQQLMDAAGQVSVPRVSASQMESFHAWMEWRETNILPGDVAIDVDGAAAYAEELIARYAAIPDAQIDTTIRKQREAAYMLVRQKSDDQYAMATQEILAALEDVAAVRDMPKFPKAAKSLDLGMIKGSYAQHEFRAVIVQAKRYFSAVRKDKQADDIAKANAMSLAALWQDGKRNPQTLEEMKKLDFYGDLDRLLQLALIKNDFR